jgi:Glu-tRNA(Gln) amidotransferase subunit E-like FAD-binding protein
LSEEIADVITLSRFLRFHQLTDAISAAVAVNYFIGDDEKALEEFIKTNGLEEMSTDEICEIIKLYEDQFRLIEIKAKEEMMKINEVVES